MKTDHDHERIEELIVAWALDGLDPEDHLELARTRAAHADCLVCQGLEAEYAEVAASMAEALEPATLRRGFEDEVVRAATAEKAFLRPEPERAGRRRERRGPGIHVKAWLAGVAAALALILGGVGGYLAGGTDGGEPVVAAFSGDAQGTLAVVYRPGTDEAFLVGSGLDAPPQGQTYQLWLIEGEIPVSGGVFEPTDGTVTFRVPSDVAAVDLLAVTVERDGGVRAPTKDPILTARVA